MYKTLITVDELHAQIDHPQLLVVDCRFELSDTEAGRNAYLNAHIPGAIYAHLDEDLSGEIIPGTTGRHPLAEPKVFEATLKSWGLDTDTQVVAYDDKGGGIAARLWWMLKAMGHEAAAVLDGGIQAWEKAGHALTDQVKPRTPGNFQMKLQENMAVSVMEVERKSAFTEPLLVDARAAIRYRGEHEPIDPVAGHIPAAVSAPWPDNLDEQKFFKSREALKARFDQVLKKADPQEVICYCGSGVTACHNLLAMEHAGIQGAKLYPGSWSHWITQPQHKIAKS